MKSKIIIMTTDEEQCQKLIYVLEKKHYHASPIRSLTDLERLLKSIQCGAIILDLDTISVDNQSIRELKTKNPDIYIIALSTRQLHPELKEAIATHIYACLDKPVDPNELFYLLRSVYENDYNR